MTEQRLAHDDEISLVDLAAILVRRWKAMVLIFAVVVLAAFAYVLSMKPTYTYVSLYEVAEQAPVGEADSDRIDRILELAKTAIVNKRELDVVPNQFLESANTVVAKAQNLYVGPTTREFLRQSRLNSLPFSVNLSSPEHTQLVKITSEASEEMAPLVEEMHGALLERIVSNQQVLVDRQHTTLTTRLESLQAALSMAEELNKAGAAELMAGYTEQIALIKIRLDLLKGGRVVQTAVQGSETQGTSRLLIMALAAVLGGMLAVMGVFLMQFAGLVCSSLKEQES